jgi:beta-phosphoglucomutase
VFDCDGVVADTEHLWDAAGSELLGRYGIAYHRAVLKPQLTGRSMRDGVILLRELYGLAPSVDELVAERMAIITSLLREGAAYMDGFHAFFDRVRTTSRVALATGLTDELLDAVDARLRVRELFAGAVVTSSMVAKAKPAPDLFLAAAELVGVDATDVLVIEDAPLGIEAAKRAGMRCVAMTTTYDASVLAAAGPDAIVGSFEEIATG